MRNDEGLGVLRVVAERIEGLDRILYFKDKFVGEAYRHIEERIEACLSDAEKEDTV